MSFLEMLPTILLLAMVLVTFGLGLELKVEDFVHVTRCKRAVAAALILQVLILPPFCLALCYALQLPPEFAIGMMILAASPGGVTANLFSHIYGGSVALNVSLTAINTVLAIVTLPLISNLAINLFVPVGTSETIVPMQFGKILQVVGVVLIPVSLGMLTAHRSPEFARKAGRPFKILSALVLACFAIIALAKEYELIVASFASIGLALLIFNLVSMLSGYYVPRAMKIDDRSARAIGFEVGIHNSTLALYIALSVLESVPVGVPAALYTFIMYITATLFGLSLVWRDRRSGSQSVN